MDVKIVLFPETKVAAIEHRGAPALEHDTVRKLIAWKLEHRLLDPAKYRSYGVHYTDPRTTPPEQHRADFCLSFDEEVGANPYGITSKVIPARRCALVLGSPPATSLARRGETIFYDHAGEPHTAVAPRPGRVLVFPADVVHRGGVPSRKCFSARLSVAFKFQNE